MLDPSIGLEFDDPAHEYAYNGVPMLSVTRYLSNFKKPFDEDYWANHMAGKPGAKLTAEEYKGIWARKRDGACDSGNLVHEEAERIAWQVKTSKYFTYTESRHPAGVRGKMRALWAWWREHMPSISEGEVWPELRIVHPELQLAGTVDLVASNYEGVRTVVDYKQNESLTVLGKYRNMQPPFRQGKLALPDLPLWHYALQLNLYARILFDRYDFEADKLLIVHLQGDGRYREYDIAILSDHVGRMLELRRQQILDEVEDDHIR